VVDAVTHAALLKKCRLVGVPQLLDIAALFGPGNTELVTRVLDSLLAAAPWLREGIAATGAATSENLLMLAQRCAEACETPSPLSDASTRQELTDAARYFADCGATMASLVTCCPQAASDLLSGDGAGLFHALAVVYDDTLEALGRVADSDSATFRLAVGRAQAAIGRAAWALLQAAFLRQDAGTSASRREALTLTVLSMSSADAGGGRLLSYVGQRHDVAAALAIAKLGLDSAQHAQLLAAFNAPAQEASRSAAADDPHLQSQIASVRDVLPDYGEGFVAAMLDALGQNSESVMAALLDGSLPAAVGGLDTRLTLEAYKKLRPSGSGSSSSSMLSTGRPVPKPRMPTPLPAGYRKHAQRYAWQRDEALELLESSDAVIKNAAREAGERVSDDEGDGGAETRSRHDPLLLAEYEDDFDEDDDLGVAPRIASDEDSDGAEADSGPVASSNPQPRVATASSKFWLHEGRVYTYAKPGAKLVMATSTEEAHAMGQAQLAAERAQVHGLGRGGNRAVDLTGGPSEAGAAHDVGRGRGSGGRGRGRSSKEHNKAAIGNHHRKDRATAKQQRLLLGGSGVT